MVLLSLEELLRHLLHVNDVVTEAFAYVSKRFVEDAGRGSSRRPCRLRRCRRRACPSPPPPPPPPPPSRVPSRPRPRLLSLSSSSPPSPALRGQRAGGVDKSSFVGSGRKRVDAAIDNHTCLSHGHRHVPRADSFSCDDLQSIGCLRSASRRRQAQVGVRLRPRPRQAPGATGPGGLSSVLAIRRRMRRRQISVSSACSSRPMPGSSSVSHATWTNPLDSDDAAIDGGRALPPCGTAGKGWWKAASRCALRLRIHASKADWPVIGM